MAAATGTLIRRIGLAFGVVIVAAACSKSPTAPGGGSGNAGGGTPATVTAVKISGNLMPAEGATSQLAATAVMSDGSQKDVTTQATWTSSNAAVAAVSGTGLVTAAETGTADISALFQTQTGKATVQVTAAMFDLELDVESVTALDTCDDFTQGLGNGEFAVRVLAVTSDGSQDTIVQTTGYPGNPDALKVYNLGRNESKALNQTRNYLVPGQSGQSLQLRFYATEWDQQVVIIPPSTRWVPDGSMDNRSTSRTHGYADGGFSGLGTNTLTIGNSSCGLRLNYTLRATRR